MTKTSNTPAGHFFETVASTEAFTVEAPIGLDERLAASLFIYADLFAAARRRLLYVLIVIVLLLMAMIGFSSWRDNGDQGISAFLSLFGARLFGLDGLPIFLIAIPTLAYYAIQPRLVRSRLIRWLRDEQLDQPLTATYRFEPGGIMAYTPGHTTVAACQRIDSFSETPTHLFLRLKGIENVFVLPRHVLSSEQIARIKDWTASCHTGGAGETHRLPGLDANVDPSPLVACHFETTVADREAVVRWQMERPGMRRRRRRGFILAFIVTAFIIPLCAVVMWLMDADRVPFRYAFPLFIEMFTSHFWRYALGFWAIIAFVILINPWLRGRQAYQFARQLHKREQAIDHDIRLYNDRVEAWQSGLRHIFDIDTFEQVERVGQHLILSRQAVDPLILPSRVFDEDKLAIFERAIDHQTRQGSRRSGVHS